MTSLFACTCNQPQHLHEALAPVRSLLVAPGPVARWGLGYIQSGEVLLSRTPRRSPNQVDLYAALGPLHADYVVGHATADDGLHGTANTQPFRFRRWVFAATDRDLVGEFDTIRDAILEHIPDFLRRNIRGTGPAEHLFHVFLSFLHDAGSLDDPNLPPTHSRLALRDALALLDGLTYKHKLEGKLGDMVLSNGRSTLGVSLGAGLYWRRLKIPVQPREAETFSGVLVVSADHDPERGFEAIPRQTVLAISRDFQTSAVPLDR